MAKHLAKYYAKVDGTDEYVDVKILNQKGGEFVISVDGKEYNVDYSMSFDKMHSFIIDNVSYGVDMSGQNGVYDIQRAGDFFRVEVVDEMKKYLKERISKGLQGRQIIDTSMPGLILKILVKVGQEVKAGDPLMILVAMKMENELKAPKDGVVQEIFVSEGNVVAAGDKLVVVE